MVAGFSAKAIRAQADIQNKLYGIRTVFLLTIFIYVFILYFFIFFYLSFSLSVSLFLSCHVVVLYACDYSCAT